MVKACGYVRVSTQEQANTGVSVEAQIATLKAYATMRGLDLVEIIVDAGVSGGKPLLEREGGQRLLALVKKRKVSAVVSTKLDRLFRNAADCLNTTSSWDQVGCALHLIDIGGQTLDTSSATGRLFLTVLAGAAELEKNLVGERTRAALKHKASKGERISRFAKIGYSIDDSGKVIANEQEQEAVAAMRKLRAAGYSTNHIAKILNRRGVKARGKAWYATSVASALAA